MTDSVDLNCHEVRGLEQNTKQISKINNWHYTIALKVVSEDIGTQGQLFRIMEIFRSVIQSKQMLPSLVGFTRSSETGLG